MREIQTFLEKQKEHHDPVLLKRCLDLLHIEIPKKNVILVAGTNGKGSTCATLQTLLIAACKNVGFFSSPHLIKLNERIRFNGRNISDAEFCRIFEIIHQKVKSFHLSYFEYLTLIATYYFLEKEVDFAIFEVGLGGILDATNAIPHDISVITKLGLEHENILGRGIESIAKNKLGIVLENNIVFHLKFPKEVWYLAEQTKSEKHAKFFETEVYNYWIEKGERYPKYYIQINDDNYELNLLGKRAVENTSLAVQVFKYLIPNYEQYLSSLKYVNWPCRMERISYKSRDVFLSGDHNPQGIQSLLEILKNFNFDSVHFVIGTCFDKDCEQMIKLLQSEKNSHIYLTETPEKTLQIEDYPIYIKSVAEFSSREPILALDAAINRTSEKDLIVVTGSLYLTGFIKKSISA